MLTKFDDFILLAYGAGCMLFLTAPLLITAGVSSWIVIAGVIILMSPRSFGASEWHSRGPRWERQQVEKDREPKHEIR